MATDYKAYQGNYTSQWLSMRNPLLKPQYLPKVYQKYGKAFTMLDFLDMTGRGPAVKGRELFYFEKDNYKHPVTLSTAIATGAAGANITFKISSDDYDANGNPTLRVHQVVYIPQKYQPVSINVPQNYRVMSRSGSPGDYTFTASPMNTSARISVEIPVGTSLSIGMLQFAPGTGLPAGVTQGYYKRSFHTTLLKEQLSTEGGFLSHEFWEPIYNDGKLIGHYVPLLEQAEFQLDNQINEYILLGQKNDNNSIVMESNAGGNNKVLSGEGIWHMLDDRGMPMNYTTTWSQDQYTSAKNAMESQGVINNEVAFAMGSGLYDQTDEADHEYIKEYSGGSDLLKNMYELGFQAQVVFRNGVRFHKIKLHNFSDPHALGNPEYDFTNSGFMMPMSKVTVYGSDSGNRVNEKKTMAMHNIELRFLASEHEDRTRVVGYLNGITGVKGAGPSVHEYDTTTWGMLTEPMLLFANVNQCIIIRKTPDNP